MRFHFAREWTTWTSVPVAVTEKLTGRRAYLAVDGYAVADLESGDLLEVRCADKCVNMLDLGHRSFFDRLEKLA